MTTGGPAGHPLAAAGRATLILTGGAVLVQLIGFFRQLFLAAEVGIAGSLDAFFIAVAMPEALAAVLTGGVAVALVPAYASVKEEQGTQAARRLVGTVLVWLGLAGLVLSGAVWIFAEPIVAITAPGMEQAAATAAVGYVKTLAPLTALASVAAVLGAACQAERLFPAMTVSMVAGPLLTLVVMVGFWGSLGLDGLVIGSLAGAVLSLVILLSNMVVHRVPPSLRFVSRGLGLGALARHAAPLTLSRALLQVQRVVDRAVASALVPGGVSALRYGDSLVRIPFGAIRPAYQTAVYPTLVQAARDPVEAALGPTTQRLLRYGLVFFVPLAGLTMAVAPLATSLLYDRGQFTEADLALTSQVVAVSAPIIVTWTVQPALVSALNARRKGTLLLASGIITMVTNIVLDVVLGSLIGVPGVALATVIASVIVVNFMGNRLSRIEPGLAPMVIWRTFLRATLATLPSAILVGVPIWAGVMPRGLVPQAGALVLIGVFGLLSYYALARRLGLPEAESIIAFALGTVRRRARP